MNENTNEEHHVRRVLNKRSDKSIINKIMTNQYAEDYFIIGSTYLNGLRNVNGI